MRSASIERHTYAADPICAPGADSSPTSLIELKAQEAEVKATEAKAAEAKAACPSSAMSLAPRAHHPSILDSGRTDSGGGAPTGAEPLNGSRSASGDPLSRTGSSFRAQDGSDGQHCQTSFKNLRARPKPPQQCVLDSKYQLGEELGRGSSGKVYRALNRETGDFRAIKQIPACNMPIGHLEAVQSEIDLLHNLQHPQIVRYFETIRTEEHLYLVLEYVENGSLATLVKHFGALPEHLVCVYVHQVLIGLEWLHEQGVCHRDIKGANLLITKDGQVKLADFGVAKKEDSRPTAKNSVVGTPYWMAPEIIQMSAFTTASDIWSLGCTILELLTGEPPYYELKPITALYRIVQDEHPPLPSDLSPALLSFVTMCFTRDPAARPTASQLRRHAWLEGARDAAASRASALMALDSVRAPPKRIGQLEVQTVTTIRSGSSHRGLLSPGDGYESDPQGYYAHASAPGTAPERHRSSESSRGAVVGESSRGAVVGESSRGGSRQEQGGSGQYGGGGSRQHSDKVALELGPHRSCLNTDERTGALAAGVAASSSQHTPTSSTSSPQIEPQIGRPVLRRAQTDPSHSPPDQNLYPTRAAGGSARDSARRGGSLRSARDSARFSGTDAAAEQSELARTSSSPASSQGQARATARDGALASSPSAETLPQIPVGARRGGRLDASSPKEEMGTREQLGHSLSREDARLQRQSGVPNKEAHQGHSRVPNKEAHPSRASAPSTDSDGPHQMNQAYRWMVTEEERAESRPPSGLDGGLSPFSDPRATEAWAPSWAPSADDRSPMARAPLAPPLRMISGPAPPLPLPPPLLPAQYAYSHSPLPQGQMTPYRYEVFAALEQQQHVQQHLQQQHLQQQHLQQQHLQQQQMPLVGFLWKRSRSWMPFIYRCRFFYLVDDALCYRTKRPSLDTDEIPPEIPPVIDNDEKRIPLATVTCVRMYSKLKYEFEVVCKHRSYRLRAPSAQALALWVAAISSEWMALQHSSPQQQQQAARNGHGPAVANTYEPIAHAPGASLSVM